MVLRAGAREHPAQGRPARPLRSAAPPPGGRSTRSSPTSRRSSSPTVSGTHVAILNKFNVVDRHLLIVTREFEEQRSLLTPRDFEAWWRCLGEYESIGFYNGGAEAGASQPHKHLQLVPLPLAPLGPAVPIEPLLPEVPGEQPGQGRSPASTSSTPSPVLGAATSERDAAREAFERYAAMLEQVGLRPPSGTGLRPAGRPLQSDRDQRVAAARAALPGVLRFHFDQRARLRGGAPGLERGAAAGAAGGGSAHRAPGDGSPAALAGC